MLLLAPGSCWDASDVHLRKDPACFQHLLLSNQCSSRECSLYEPLSSVDQLQVSLVCCFLVPLKFRPMTDGWMKKQWQTSAWTRKKKTTGARSNLQEMRRSAWRKSGELKNQIHLKGFEYKKPPKKMFGNSLIN